MAVEQQADSVSNRLHKVIGLPRLGLTCVKLCNSNSTAQGNQTAARVQWDVHEHVLFHSIPHADD
jgi:hypothetical protein